LETEWGNKTASVFVKKTYDVLDLLSEFPLIGSLEHKEKQIRGINIVKQITMFYKIQNDRILILHFFDNRQSPGRKRL